MNNLTHEIGRLELIERLENETLEKQCQRLLEKRYGKYALEEYDSYIEAFKDGFYKEYIIIEDKIYKILLYNDLELQHFEKIGDYFDVLYDEEQYDFESAVKKAFKKNEHVKSFKEEYGYNF